MTDDIRQLWKAIRANDARAWRRLVRLYADLVFTVARRTGLSELDAEDCSQQTWIALYRNRKSIKDPSALPAWLIRTTHRRAVRLARQMSRTTDLEAAESLADPAELPDETIQRLEQEHIIASAIRQLDPRCRKLLQQLYFGSGRTTYREIARSLGLKPDSLGPLRSRCIERLRKVLGKMGYATD